MPSIVGAHETPQTLTAIGKPPQAAKLTSIDNELNATFEVHNASEKTSNITVDRTDLVRWGSMPDIAEQHQLLLVDGSLLLADIDTLQNGTFSCKSRLWGSFEIKAEFVFGVNLVPARDYARRHLQIAALKSVDDPTMFMSNGDRLAGPVVSIDPTSDEDLRLIQMKGDSDIFDFAFPSVSRFSLGKKSPRKSSRLARIGFIDGSLLNVDTIDVRDGAIDLTLTCGANIAYRNPRTSPIAAISYIQSTNRRVSYLSETNPLQSKTVPMLTASYDAKMNESCIGSPLNHRNKIFPTGIGMHATSSSAFSVEKNSTRFAAEIAIDQSAGKRGSVICRAFLLDDSGTWQSAFESKIIRGGDDAVPLSFDLGNAKAIAISVDQSDHGDILDRVNWLNARFEE